jgi:hypothetical protein
MTLKPINGDNERKSSDNKRKNNDSKAINNDNKWKAMRIKG